MNFVAICVLNFVTVWDFRFCHSLSFQNFVLLEIRHQTFFLVFSRVEVLGLSQSVFLSFVTIWLFEFWHILSKRKHPLCPCHKQIMDLSVHLPSSSALHIHTKLLISKHWEMIFLAIYVYVYVFKKKHLMPNIIATRNFKKKNLPNILTLMSLAMYYTGSFYYLEVFKYLLKTKKHPKTLKLLCQHFSLPDFVET